MAIITTSEKCDLEQPHIFHSHTVTKQGTCDGQTKCGVKSHDPHIIGQEVSVWCEGICEWCSRNGTLADHGAGEHK